MDQQISSEKYYLTKVLIDLIYAHKKIFHASFKLENQLVSAGLCQHICLTVAFLAGIWVPYGCTGPGIADKQPKEGNGQAEHNPQHAECVVKEPRQAAILQQNAPPLSEAIYVVET